MAYKISHSTLSVLNLPSISTAFLAIDSRVCDPHGIVVSNTYNKIIDLRPCVFLVCTGDFNFIEQIRDSLVSNLPNFTLIGEIALYVQNTINKVLENLRNENGETVPIEIARSPRFARLVLAGRGPCDSRNYFYIISKGKNTWMYLAKRVVEKQDKVVCCGASTVGRFLQMNKLDEGMSEEQVVDYAFRSVKYSVSDEECYFSGGKIQVVVMKPDSSIVHAWEQNDPTNPHNEYIYQDCNVINQVLQSLAADLPNKDRSMGEIALFVQNTVNTIRENNPPEENEEEDEDDFTLPRFVLLGRGCGDNRHYFFKITKGENTNMYFAKREVGHVVFAGSEGVNSFLEENDLDYENVSEDDAVKYAFECLKDAVENDWIAGGRIQVVAMKPGGGSSVLHSWEQSDPSICDSEYIYQVCRTPFYPWPLSQ